jgi:FkbM family methyltransferase
MFDKERYVTFRRMRAIYPSFWQNTARFLSAKGTYLYRCEVRTPAGIISPTIYSSDDFFTLNEIFCRNDYEMGAYLSTVLDIGSNIGLSALYFLTRNPDSYCYLHEPNPANIERLKRNLEDFEERFSLSTTAVGVHSGTVSFGVEPTGRYGGILLKSPTRIEVPCEHINDVIERILTKHSTIDLIKIDTEGMELATVEAIDTRFFPRISRIYMECEPTNELFPATFKQEQHWTICRLINIEGNAY